MELFAIKHLNFAYPEQAKNAISDFSLSVRPGEFLVVCGPSGCGKSTLLKLLLGWLPDYTGTIRFDGTDARDYTPEQLQRQMSYIEQDVFLFNTTIRENITLGEEFTDEQMERALGDSALTGDLAHMPEGLDTVVGEEGSNLSGGQKQRLAIARAIIKDAAIYIFDDSFSALDFLTEKNLRTALNRRIAGRTQIVVTQRITSAMSADCIFVMDGGCLVDSGTHNELLARCRIYREIYASQTGGDLQ